MESTLAFRRIVAPQHLNAANTLFGGTLMAWIDEACATYAMCQMQSKRVVTLKFGEVLFKMPAKQNDFLEFYCSTVRVGNSSLTINCEVYTKPLELGETKNLIAKCEATFVNVDSNGKSKPFVLRGSNTRGYLRQELRGYTSCTSSLGSTSHIGGGC